MTYVPQTFLSAHPCLVLYTYTGRRVLLAFSGSFPLGSFPHRWVGGITERYDIRQTFYRLFCALELSEVLVLFGFITGSCEKERLKVQFTAHRTISMTDSLTVKA